MSTLAIERYVFICKNGLVLCKEVKITIYKHNQPVPYIPISGMYVYNLCKYYHKYYFTD